VNAELTVSRIDNHSVFLCQNAHLHEDRVLAEFKVGKGAPYRARLLCAQCLDELKAEQGRDKC